jgi:hypothetical protein
VRRTWITFASRSMSLHRSARSSPIRNQAVQRGRPQRLVLHGKRGDERDGGLAQRYRRLERHVTESRERIADVRRIIDRQTASAARIDVRKGAVGSCARSFAPSDAMAG